MLTEPLDTTRVDAPISDTLSTTVYAFGGGQALSLNDCFTGVAVFGASGSGKTSGVGATLLRGLLDRRGLAAGAIVHLTKPGDLRTVEAAARATGRGDDLRALTPGVSRVNLVRYVVDGAESPGVLARHLADVVFALASAGRGRYQSGDSFWVHALEVLVYSACCVAVGATLADGHRALTLQLVYDVATSPPRSQAEVHSPDWRRSACWRACADAEACLRDGHARADAGALAEFADDLRHATGFLLRQYAALSDRTRSSVEMSLVGLLSPLLRSPIRGTLFAEDAVDQDRLAPRATAQGAIVVLDMPPVTWGEAGRVGQIAYRQVFHLWILRRVFAAGDRPVVLYADEGQLYASAGDERVGQLGRAAGLVNILMTQATSNIRAALRGEADAAASFLANYNVKIFAALGDGETARYAEDSLGKELRALPGTSLSAGTLTQFGSPGESTHVALVPVLPSSEFLSLQAGGPPRGTARGPAFHVEAIVVQPGRRWAGESESYLRHFFPQHRD